MKRKLLNPRLLKQTALAVPAAALMLGAAQAGTTIGLNFQAWYYDSGSTPQTVGYGAGYQTTGFPVTGKAFGVDVANWTSTDPQDCRSALNGSLTEPLTISWTAPNAWQSGIGELNQGWVSEAVAPGDDEVTWGYLDDGNTTGSAPTVTLAGLAAMFPNGYVVQTIAANSGTHTYDPVDVTDLVITNTQVYSTYYVTNPASDSYVTGGTVGLSAATNVFTANTVYLYCQPKTSGSRSVLAGFIVTDKPVVSKKPLGGAVNQGATFALTAGAIGIAPLSYQWRLYGTNIPGATTTSYSVASAGQADSGPYDLVASNAYGLGTSVVASVTIRATPVILKDLDGSSGTIYSGGNFSQWSIVAGGTQPLHYNWLQNGNTSVGTDNPTLTLSTVTTANTGDYSVRVSNISGSAQSATNHLVVVASPNSYSTKVAQDSPAAYWPLNEASGTSALDYSGLGHFGTNTGGLTLGVPGPRPPTYAGFDASKTAYQFDGSSSYVDFGTGPSLSGTTDFTLEAWVYTTSTAAGQIIQQRDPAGFDGEYMLGLNGNGTVSFTVYGGGYQFNFSTSKSVNDGRWHHIAAVRSNGTNGIIYLDGAAAASRSSTTIAPLAATIKTYIGADVRGAGAGPTTFFNGLICDVAIHNIALSPSRIGQHAYTGLLGTAPLSIQFAPGGFIVDSRPSGPLHPGSNLGATWVASVTDTAGTPVTRTGVETFTGGSQIATPGVADLNNPSGTIMFWMRANAPLPGPGNEGAMLFDWRTTNGAVIFMDDAGEISFQGPGGSRNQIAGGYLPDNNWHHVAVSYGQTSSDSISIYVDGQLAASTPVTNTWSWPADQELEIGTSHDTYWKHFNGDLDDFRIYNRVLTGSEITQVYQQDAIVDTAALVLRYNFQTSGGGQSLVWPVGRLQSSPTLGPSAVWTDVPNAASPYPFLPPPPSTPPGSMLFYRIAL